MSRQMLLVTCVLLLILVPGWGCSCSRLCCWCCCNCLAGDSCLTTTHVSPVELDKNRNLKSRVIFRTNTNFECIVFSLVASLDIRGQKRVEKTQKRRSLLRPMQQDAVLQRHSLPRVKHLLFQAHVIPKGTRPAQVYLDKFFLRDANIFTKQVLGPRSPTRVHVSHSFSTCQRNDR